MPLSEIELMLKYCNLIGIKTLGELKAFAESKHCATNNELKDALAGEYIERFENGEGKAILDALKESI